MARAPRLCAHRTCRAIATNRSHCDEHAPKPFSGSKDRWAASRPGDWERIRLRVLERDRKTCQICGAPSSSEVDHIVPVAFGGDWSLSNLRTLCKTCHQKKTQEDARRGRALRAKLLKRRRGRR